MTPECIAGAPAPVRVAVIDDDPIVRTHLETVIRDSEQFALALGAGTFEGAQTVLRKPPDVVLLDLGLPDGSGIELIRWLKKEHDVIVLVVTVFEDQISVTRSFATGADGYLVKDATPTQIVDAIKSALDGGTPISAAAATHLLDRLRSSLPQDNDNVPEHRPGFSLTPREVQLLELFAKGLTYQESAMSLGISRHTVNDHVKSIYRKLGVNSRSEAVYEALQDNIIRMPH